MNIMMTIFSVFAYLSSHAVALTIVLFAWYLVAMFFLRRKRQLREKLGPVLYVIVMVVVGGIPLDIFYQWFIAPIIFREFTMNLTLSKRLEMYRESPKYKGTWRMRWADFICERILNPFDPDKHHC